MEILSDDVLGYTFEFLNFNEILLNIGLVCQRFRKVCRFDSFHILSLKFPGGEKSIIEIDEDVTPHWLTWETRRLEKVVESFQFRHVDIKYLSVNSHFSSQVITERLFSSQHNIRKLSIRTYPVISLDLWKTILKNNQKLQELVVQVQRPEKRTGEDNENRRVVKSKRSFEPICPSLDSFTMTCYTRDPRTEEYTSRFFEFVLRSSNIRILKLNSNVRMNDLLTRNPKKKVYEKLEELEIVQFWNVYIANVLSYFSCKTPNLRRVRIVSCPIDVRFLYELSKNASFITSLTIIDSFVVAKKVRSTSNVTVKKTSTTRSPQKQAVKKVGIDKSVFCFQNMEYLEVREQRPNEYVRGLSNRTDGKRGIDNEEFFLCFDKLLLPLITSSSRPTLEELVYQKHEGSYFPLHSIISHHSSTLNRIEILESRIGVVTGETFNVLLYCKNLKSLSCFHTMDQGWFNSFLHSKSLLSIQDLCVSLDRYDFQYDPTKCDRQFTSLKSLTIHDFLRVRDGTYDLFLKNIHVHFPQLETLSLSGPQFPLHKVIDPSFDHFCNFRELNTLNLVHTSTDDYFSSSSRTTNVKKSEKLPQKFWSVSSIKRVSVRTDLTLRGIGRGYFFQNEFELMYFIFRFPNLEVLEEFAGSRNLLVNFEKLDEEENDFKSVVGKKMNEWIIRPFLLGEKKKEEEEEKTDNSMIENMKCRMKLELLKFSKFWEDTIHLFLVKKSNEKKKLLGGSSKYDYKDPDKFFWFTVFEYVEETKFGHFLLKRFIVEFLNYIKDCTVLPLNFKLALENNHHHHHLEGGDGDDKSDGFDEKSIW